MKSSTLENITVDLNNKNIILYSFDVFDTLITRCVAEPIGIFSIMQKKLVEEQTYNNISSFVRKNFFTLRTEAESYARINKFETESKQDVSLYEIYEVIKNNNNLSAKDINRLIELEISTEINNIRPISKNINYLKRLKEYGHRVVLISDMYHSSDVIRKFLLSIDPIFKDIKIYVSSEIGKTKHFGDLYSVVQDIEKINPINWQHIGDNKYADIKQAKSKSINAKLYLQETMLRYEEKALKYLGEDFCVQALIGLARLTRIQKDKPSDAYSLGVSYAGPILYNYVSWIINQALEKNIKSLNFIARDGFVLKNIADIIIRKRQLLIKTNYIYGSRIAWRIPDENNIESYVAWFCDEYLERLNLEFLASRFDIDIELLKQYSGIMNTKKVLKLKEIQLLKNNLINNSEFKTYLVRKNQEKKELLKKYFSENIDLTEPTLAFVDVHGSGRTQDMLANLLKEFSSGEVVGFYYHTCFNCTQKISKKYTYLATGNYVHHAIELFCRNLDGQTIGYEQTEQNVKPVLEKIDSTQLLKWGYNDYLQGLMDYTTNACDFEICNNISLLSYTLYKNYFNYLMKDLDKHTADILGSIPYADVGSELDGKECAPKYGLIASLKYLMTGKVKSYTHFISLARSAKCLKKFQKINDKYGSLRRFLLHVSVNKTNKQAYIRFFGLKVSFSKLIWRKM